MKHAGVALLAIAFALAAAAQAPRIDALYPRQGPAVGGTEVIVTGANFDGASLRIDASDVVPLARTSSSFTLRMPGRPNGYVVISARNASGAAYGEFLYVPPRLEDLPPGHITTVAGVGAYARDFGDAKNAKMNPGGLALQTDGTLYVAQPNLHNISRVRTDGTIERVTARDGVVPGDGLHASEVQVSFPLSVTVDRAGNVYIPDQYWRIRRVDAATGIITTLLGDGISESSGDGGPAKNARVAHCNHIAADERDVFFLDFLASRIRRIDLVTGIVTSYAGNGTAGFSGDNGPAAQAQIDTRDGDAGHLALDSRGNLYLADTANFRVRRIDRNTGLITTFYELPRQPGIGYVNAVRSIALDAQDNLYIGGSGRIVKVSSSGAFVTSWGNGTYELLAEGANASTSGLGLVTGIAIDAAGNIYYSNDAVGRVQRIDVTTNRISTYAGIGGATIGEDGPAVSAVLNAYDILARPDGTLLLNEALRLWHIDRDGTLRAIGGTGTFVGKGRPAPATETVLGGEGIHPGAAGAIELSEQSVITRIDDDGVAREVAGRGGVCDYSGDGGPATLATLCQAWDAVRDVDGNLFIADTNNNRIRRVDAKTGIITTVAGNGGAPNGYERYMQGRSCGDGGPAIDACLNTPYGIAVDRNGDLYIADHPGIRRIDASTGIITTFSPAGASKLILDDQGRLYGSSIAGVFRLDHQGALTWLVGRGGGSEAAGFSGDGGPAIDARVNIPSQAAGLSIDSEGNLFFVDGHNLRVRAVRYGAALAAPDAKIAISGAANSVLRVTVLDDGGRPQPGVRVELSAPASGPTCRLSSRAVFTDLSGEAEVTCIPSCISGSYTVSAVAAGAAATASIMRTNPDGPCRRRAVRR